MNNILLDTNIILYAAVYRDEVALDVLNDNNIFISDITEIELLGYHRINKTELSILKNLVSNINVLPINNDIKKIAIDIRRKYQLKTPDAIIASTALYFDYFLATADKKLHKIDEVNLIQFNVDY